jgi:hypothetical protein
MVFRKLGIHMHNNELRPPLMSYHTKKSTQNASRGQMWWFMPVILATQEE